MRILTAAQTRQADQATIQEEGISSAALMERAATAFTEWLLARLSPAEAGDTLIFCGPGNNGGDGLVIARQLHLAGFAVQVFGLPAATYSPDFEVNRQRLPDGLALQPLASGTLPPIAPGSLVIDALFGTGLSRPLAELSAVVVEHLNQAQARIVDLDMPSGLLADAPQPAGSPVVRARHTLSFHLSKLPFLLPQNAQYGGEWHSVPIGLSRQFQAQV